MRAWIRKAVQSFKSSGVEYTDGEVWEAVKRGAVKLAEWDEVKETLADDTFERQGRLLTRQIARVAHITQEVENEQMEFTGDGFDFQHSYVTGWTEDGEGLRRVAWAMSGDEALRAMDVLQRSIEFDQKSLKALSDEYRRVKAWRGKTSWKEATEAQNVSAGATAVWGAAQY